MPKKGLEPKDQLLFSAMIIGFGALFHVATEFRNHAQGCEKSSNRIVGLGLSILGVVMAALIIMGINAYHGNDTTQRTTMIEEKVKH